MLRQVICENVTTAFFWCLVIPINLISFITEWFVTILNQPVQANHPVLILVEFIFVINNL